MAHVVEMPKLSDTMEEGGIAKWLKKEGDSVREGEALLEIETDKATQEFEAAEGGVLLKILVPAGKTVALRTPIGVIGAAGEKVDLAQFAAAAKPAAAAAPAKVVDLPLGRKDVAAVAKPTATGGMSGGLGRVRSSPLARKVAAASGVDIAALSGSGPGGRIVMRDVEGALSSQAPQRATPPAGAGAPVQTGASAAAGVVLPVSMMRKTIAKRLTAAKNDAPHFYLTVSADVARLEDWRKKLNDEAVKAGGTLARVSLNDMVILAVARALRRHPMVNSAWQGETILQNLAVHVAFAVALPEGLVTPVLRHTDVLGVRDIAAQVRELATKAKDGKLSNDAYSGGTFTISNLGMFGIEEFTAIINPPQAAILAVGAAVPTPWVDERGSLAVQQRMKMTMSCDHRVVDGATGAQFLKTLVTYLEEPMRMMV